MDDKEILTHGRRLHDALRHAIEDGDGLKGEPRWENEERSGFEHHSCGMYLVSILAFLEGQLGEKCWNNKGSNFNNLKLFTDACPRPRYKELNVIPSRLDALHEIRNAIVHNSGDVRKNRNRNAEQMIVAAGIQGVSLNTSSGFLTLVSNYNVDFMEWVRVAFLCITEYHGQWGGPSKWK